jgi:hypothetical protein
MAVVGLKDLCTPAIVYLVISLFSMLMMLYNNYNNIDVYCLGDFSCKLHVSMYSIFMVKLLVILFWTWILNIICHNVSPYIAWFLVLLPFIIFLTILLYVMFV